MRLWPGLLLVAGGCETIFPLEIDRTPRPRGCSPMSMLVDTFDGSGDVLPPFRVPNDLTFPQIKRNSGVLRLDAVPSIATHYEAASGPFFELRGQRFSARAVLEAGFLDTGSFQIELVSQEVDENKLLMGVVGVKDQTGTVMPRLYFGHVDHLADGTEVPVLFTDLPYDATAHALWAIEQDGDVTRWLAAPLDGEFTPVFETQGLGEWVTYMRPILSADPFGSTIVVQFDDVGSMPATGDACPVGSLTETFDTEPSIDWVQLQEDCAMTFEGGELVARFGVATINHDCAIQTTTVYDLTQRPITLEVLEVTRGQSEGNAVFEVEAIDGRRAYFTSDGTTVQMFGSEMQRGIVERVPRFWRFRVENDALLFEVADDGGPFEVIGTTGVGALELRGARVAAGFVGGKFGTDAVARFGGLTSP